MAQPYSFSWVEKPHLAALGRPDSLEDLEWLRRQGRSAHAREELRTAHDMLAVIGMEAFADRARRELAATGERVHECIVEAPSALSAQEALIAWLARDGRTNPEIGAELFLSARTVEWHMSKVFTKLGITSRRELGHALSETGINATDAHSLFRPDRCPRLRHNPAPALS